MREWSIEVHCGPHARGPAPRRCTRPRAPTAREGWGTGGKWVHERGAHSELLWTISSRVSCQAYLGHFNNEYMLTEPWITEVIWASRLASVADALPFI